MQALQYKKVTDNSGSITIAGLPPSEEVTILILPSGQDEWRTKMHQWMKELREEHPFMQMTKEKILKSLKKTREDVWALEYDH